MITKMKLLENLARLYSKKFSANWDYYCIASDAYQAGFKAAREMSTELIKKPAWIVVRDTPTLGEELVDVELKDGEHQLNSKMLEGAE